MFPDGLPTARFRLTLRSERAARLVPTYVLVQPKCVFSYLNIAYLMSIFPVTIDFAY